MKLSSDYRSILRKAWSIRLMVLAGLLTGCEAGPAYRGKLQQSLDIEPGVRLVIDPGYIEVSEE